MNKGYFISFEGSDGVGKSTQIKLLESYLKDLGHELLVLREPGGTQISEAIREILLDKNNAKMSESAELLLYEAARAQLCEELIKPALARGVTVIADRFYDSSLAYQGFGRGIDLNEVQSLNEFATGGLKPDITFLLHLPNSLSRKLIDHEADRLELAGEEFMSRVQTGFLEIAKAEPERIKLIDASGSKEEVFSRIIAELPC